MTVNFVLGRDMTPHFVLGYGTNGFTDHPLPSALDVLQHHGYGAVALTLGHPHLDPFADDWRERTLELRDELRRRGLRVVVETGTRFLLDPFRKHRPTLVDREAPQRLRFLSRAVEIAALLEADCVSIWSGVLPSDVSPEQAWQLLLDRMPIVLQEAAALGVVVSFEPEPGMVVETVADALRLRSELGDPENLGITVDLGHCVAVEPDGVEGALRAAGSLLRNVQVDDMLPGVHEHLPLGDGDLDLDLALRTLVDIDYRGVAAVELPRHAHAAPDLAEASMAAITATSVFGESDPVWLTEALDKIANDPSTVDRLFAGAGRGVGRGPVDPADPHGYVSGTVDDAARARLLAAALPEDATGAAEVVRRLYHRGDDAERRGVLAGLNRLTGTTEFAEPVLEAGREVVRDALRLNDPRIVAVALGDFSAAHLDQHGWRHGVLKAVFMEVPLVAVSGLETRGDDELQQMAQRLVTEREAAGRVISADLAALAG